MAPPATLDYVKAAIEGVGLLSLVLLVVQLRSANRWKRLEYSLNAAWKADIARAWKAVNDYDPEGLFAYAGPAMSEEEYRRAAADPELLELLKDYFNCFEEISCLVNLRALDEEYSYAMFSKDLATVHAYFGRLLGHFRALEGDEDVFSGIERLHARWRGRFERERRSWRGTAWRGAR